MNPHYCPHCTWNHLVMNNKQEQQTAFKTRRQMQRSRIEASFLALLAFEVSIKP
jgi:hypothetical protein